MKDLKTEYKDQRKIVFEGQNVSRHQSDNLTCLHIAPHTVIDAGMMPQPRDGQYIENIFLTHTHLDHICALAWYVDAHFSKLLTPIRVYASQSSIDALNEHFFNNKLWPDFSKIILPNCNRPAIKYMPIAPDEIVRVEDLHVQAVESLHCEGSFSYIITHEENAIYFTSDTYYDPRIAERVNANPKIGQLIADVSFASWEEDLAKAACHLTPNLLAKIKEECRDDLIINVFHVKFAYQDEIFRELEERDVLGEWGKVIKNGSFIHFDTNWLRTDSDASKARVYTLEEEKKLETILSCFSNMSRSTDAVKNLQELGRMVRANIGADRCSVWLIDNSAREYYTLMADGVTQIRVPFGKGIVGAVIDSKMPLLENDPYSNLLFDRSSDARTGYRTKAILAMPILNSDREIIGVFQALNKLTNLDGSFSRDDFDYVQIAADYSGRIFEGIKFHEDMMQAQKDMIYSIAEMVESRSAETGNHVKRVGLISEVLARALGYSEEDVKLIGIGAPTHDIGKIGIPDSILNKPGKLTDEEFKFMQKHSQIGYDMLRRFKGKIVETAAAIAHEHHEKYGGGGYPRGIKGEAIHPFARIVALADVFDALASDRCYKKAWPLNEVEDFLRANSGSHFDPKVVDAFFACKDEIYRINRELADTFNG